MGRQGCARRQLTIIFGLAGKTLNHSEITSRPQQEGNKPNSGGVLLNFRNRTINLTEYRHAKDDVNPAKNRRFGGITDHLIPFH